MIIDKQNLIPTFEKRDSIHLELGCGAHKRDPNAIGIDLIDHECVDIVGDIFEVLAAIPTNSVHSIQTYHFIEHIENLVLLLSSIARVLKTSGNFEVVVPHFSNPWFYSDYTHKSFFGLYTFCYFAENTLFRRQVPQYVKPLPLALLHVDLIFKSTRPFYVRHGLKKIEQWIFNSCTYMQELYEEQFCYLFPSYEIRYILKKIENN